ncbi:MAG: SDR family oxidoreductase [Deltaproteobacteria bacterium]|nr:SDR family oxidoreductase [Deltaproteobacteria bacterium]MBW2726919.1 SDR family oxidoreductase [Deltaproteobacteria bacterium]
MAANLSLEGKVAFVTGASRGIGRAIALALAEAGADIAIADLHPAPFEGERYFRMKKRVSGSDEETRTAEAVSDLGHRAIEIELDVSDAEAVSQAVADCEQQLGSLDIVVNNAGIVNNIAPIASMQPDAWEHELRVNLGGAFHCVRAAAPRMAERGWGRVVNISSIAARSPSLGQPAYAASKAGVIAFTQSVAQEFGRQGVTANAVLPGLIATPLVLSMPGEIRDAVAAQTPVGRVGEPAEIGSLVAYLCSPAAGFITATAIPCDGGFLGAPVFGLNG